MPLNDNQKNYILQQMGVSPDEYQVDETTQSVVPKIKQQPALNTTTYQPKLETGIPNPNSPQIATSTPLEAFGKSALEAAPSSLAGGAGAAGTLALLGGLGLDMTGVGALLGIPLMAGGAYAAAKGTKALQRKIEPQEWQQGVAQAQQEHPIASTVGALSTIPLSGFGPNNPKNIATALRAFPKLFTKGFPMTGEEAGQLANVGIGAALPPIQSIVESEASGHGMPSGKSLLMDALLGGVMSKPNVLGRAMGFHDVSTPTEEFGPEHLAKKGTAKPVKVEAPIDTTGELENAIPTKGIEEMEPEESPADILIKQAQKELEPGLKLKSKATTTEGATTEETRKALMGIKNQESSAILTEPEQQVAKLLEEKGYSGSLTGHWFNLAQEVAGKRGAKLAIDKDLATAGQTSIPTFRNTIDAIIAKINPNKAGADTPVHELQHIFRNDLRNSDRPRDQEFVSKYDKLVEGLPDYQQWSEKRKAAGLDSSIEEYEVTNQGVESVNRAMSEETPFQRWKNDFGAYLQTRWGKHADVGDYQRLMNYRLLHDPSYRKIVGAGESGAIKKQEESNITIPAGEEGKLQLPEDETSKVNELYKRGDINLDQAEKLLIGNVKNQDDSNLKPNKPYYNYNDLDLEHEKVLETKNPDEFPSQPAKSFYAYAESKYGIPMGSINHTVDTPEGRLAAVSNANHPAGHRYEVRLIPYKKGNLEGNINPELDRMVGHIQFLGVLKHEALANNDFDKVEKLDKTINDIKNQFKQPVNYEGRRIDIRNQEQSNLVSPKHDSIVTNVKKAIEGKLEPDELMDLQDALRTQVNWPKESMIPKVLNDKQNLHDTKGEVGKFDPLNVDHWKQLNQIYNNEYDSYGKKATPVSPRNTEVGSGKIEAPRTIPTEALEATKSAEEAKQTQRKVASAKKPTTTVLDLTKEPAKIVAEGPKPISTDVIQREEPLTKKEQASQKKFSKMQWSEIDNTTNPQATMDSLKSQYDAATERQHSAFAEGDRDLASEMADFRTATLMRMHYLGEKKGVEIPKMERFQEESRLLAKHYIGDVKDGFANGHISGGLHEAHAMTGLSSRDGWRYRPDTNKVYWNNPPTEDNKIAVDNFLSKKGYEPSEHTSISNWTGQNPVKYQPQSNLPDLHNRVGEFDEKYPETQLKYLTPKGFTTQLDKIRKTEGPEGNQLADEYEKYAPLKDKLFGEPNAATHNALKGLSDADRYKIEQVGIMNSREKADNSNLLNPKQKAAFDKIRAELDKIKPDDPHFWPQQISPRVAEQIAENTPSTERLKNDFIEHQLKYGKTLEDAEDNWEKLRKSYDAGTTRLDKFGLLHETEGIGLPDSFLKPGLEKNLSRFYSRAASDRAFRQTFAANPDVMKSAFGRKNDLNGNPITSSARDISGNKDVKALTERVTGEPFDKDESWIKAINRLATSLMLGPSTNLHIGASSVANSAQYFKPVEYAQALTHSLIHITDGYQKAVEQGKIRPNLDKLRDIIDTNNTGIERLRVASSIIGKINGRDATINFTHALLQNMGEWLINSRRILADAGDKSAIDLMKRVDPDWAAGKQYTPEDLSNLASTFAGIIHGSHDARTLPGWMLKDTAIQPFFSLASWNIAQTNAWTRHVLTPAMNGNFTPLIMSTLGSVLGGYVIKKGREALADKKSPIPSLEEIVNSSRGAEGNIPLIAYNLAAMSSYVGYAGILSVGAKAGFDLAYKNIPQAATFPLDEVLGNSVHRIGQVIGALMNDPNADYLSVGSRLAIDLAKENVQMARLVTSWASKSSTLQENIPGLEQEGYSKELNQKTSDLRRFKMVEGLPYSEQSASESNPYLSTSMKTFKRSQDLGEAVQQLPDLLSAAFTKANGNIDVLKSEFHKLKANTYPTMPDPESMPTSFVRYLNFLSNTQGSDVATERMMDYMRHKAINQAKSSMVPSL